MAIDRNVVPVVYARCAYSCVYCGFDGRSFDSWMQMSIDHVRPSSCGGTDEPSNLVAACRSCNSITGPMKFTPEQSREEIFQAKKSRAREIREGAFRSWLAAVAPKYLEKPPAPELGLPSPGTDPMAP
jgi:5-methylcytosine-specific restriction endonuclease McrA